MHVSAIPTSNLELSHHFYTYLNNEYFELFFIEKLENHMLVATPVVTLESIRTKKNETLHVRKKMHIHLQVSCETKQDFINIY